MQHRDHGDDGHGSDQDAERRQNTAQAMRIETREGGLKGFGDHVHEEMALGSTCRVLIVLDDPAVENTNGPSTMRGDIRLVGDHHHGLTLCV